MKIAKDNDLITHNRSASTASDTASMVDVMHEIITDLQLDDKLLLLLQPTSPFRLQKDYVRARNLLDYQTNSVVSMSKVQQHPSWMYQRKENSYIQKYIQSENIYRRQDLSDLYYPNGMLYLIKIGALKKFNSFYPPKTKILEIPKKRSIDIDNELDWKLADLLYEEYVEWKNTDR